MSMPEKTAKRLSKRSSKDDTSGKKTASRFKEGQIKKVIDALKEKKKTSIGQLQCVAEHGPLQSIKNNRQLAEAIKTVEILIAKDRDTAEEVYFETLSDLIEAYEDKHVEIDNSTPSQMLVHLLDAQGLTQSELARRVCVSRSTISEIVSGRNPSVKVAIKLARYFKVNVALFISSN